ncbi:uncharacterized protein LOC119560118 [Drosophila subpulchrella]|uniref:uncharacterized protein LOC119560118 n=1 Tax=Drosophila subpulchrella TaxID=1486046 RepID=UPI0018A166C0|nr:uncharacterized protein LOC119560118 [Drosophila subpulchrella]
MNTISVLMLFVLLAIGVAAQAPLPGNDPTVSILSYKNDQDLEKIQRQIIAQYERFGGTTYVHKPLTARTINPASLGTNI